MIPWVRGKLAESRLRWQNRKQQRNELIASVPSISTVSVDNASARSYASSTNARRLDSIDEIPAPTTSAFLEVQNGKRRSSAEYVAADTNTNQLVQRNFSIIHHQTFSNLNAEYNPKEHRRPGLVVVCLNSIRFAQC